jgi:hypothetical protein
MSKHMSRWGQFWALFHPSVIAHPIFVRETRGIRWTKTGDTRRRFVRTWLIVPPLIIMLIFGCDVITQVNAFSGRLPASRLSAMLNSYVIMITFLSLGARFFADLRYLSISNHSISSDITSKRWQLIQLTPLSIGGIIRAKHAAVQAHVWGLTLALISVRPLVLFASLFATFIYTTAYDTFGLSSGDALITLSVNVLATIFALILAAAEPIFVMRAHTAIGLAISATTTHNTSISVMSLLALMAIWIVQFIGVIASGFFLVFLLLDIETPLFVLLYIPFLLTSCMIAIVLQTIALRHVARRLIIMER